MSGSFTISVLGQATVIRGLLVSGSSACRKPSENVVAFRFLISRMVFIAIVWIAGWFLRSH